MIWRNVDMRVALLGTGQWGFFFLKRLVATTSVVGIVTQPGNSGLTGAARKGRIDLCTVTRAQGEEYGSFIRKLGVDLIVSAGFPFILPMRILRLPGLGAINIHGSYLPAYRGPQPVEWQIINGESRCGVTIHRMDRGIDTGEILIQDYVSISDADTLRTVTMKLCRTGGRLLDELVPQIANGSVRGTKQDATSASYYGRLSEDDVVVDWIKSTQVIYNLTRALPPHFPAFSMIDGVRCYFLQARCINESGFEAPGTIVRGISPSNSIIVKTGDGYLEAPKYAVMSSESLPIPIELAMDIFRKGRQFQTHETT